MKTNKTAVVVALLAVTVLAGCTTYYPNDNVRQYPAYPQATYPAQGYPAASYPQQQYPTHNQGYTQGNYAGDGIVDSIQPMQIRNEGSGGGALAGGVVGGVLGNQVGKGGGRAVATAAGLIGGALLGNQIERNASPGQQYYQVNIRLNNGGFQSFNLQNPNGLQVGERVRVENNQIYRY